jgi:hypothetical protein
MVSNESPSIEVVTESEPTQAVQEALGAPDDVVADELYLDDPRGVELSSPYVDRWEVLVSTTNWEKGRIICEWRAALESDGAPVSAFSDEAWSRRVGGVTSQHVGRLRRVATRFGNSCASYPNLSWTHFLAALDWEDAEMWLEGATQSKWSVSAMREARWETLGSDPATAPAAVDIASAPMDEDFTELAEPIASSTTAEKGEVAEGPTYEGPDFGDEDREVSAGADAAADAEELPWEAKAAEPIASPFASLPRLPVDVADAMEQFKLAIIRHRASGWEELPQSDLLQAIDALRAFATQ